MDTMHGSEGRKKMKMQHGAGCMCPSCQMQSGNMCGCGCGMGGGYRFRVLRWIFGLAVLVIVFLFGMKVGEVKGMLDASHYGFRNGYARAYPMMQMMPSGMTATTTATSSGK